MKPLFFLLKHSRGRRFIYSLLQSIILFLTMVGCSMDPMDDTIVETPQTKGGTDAGTDDPSLLQSNSQMEFGEPLPDTHSVSAMREAYRQLYPNGGAQYGPNAIKTTHLYVRFLPKSDEEYESIMHYGLSDIPLHLKITKNGSSYHDADIPIEQYSGQYAVVRVGTLNTAVQYEVINELFLPDEVSNDGSVGITGAAGPSGGGESMSFWETLEAASERIANGQTLTTDIREGLKGAPGGTCRPHGRIMTWDDKLGKLVPVSGAHVFVWHNQSRKGEAYADENGYFVVDRTFKSGYEMTYRVKWGSHNDFLIYDGGGKSEAFCSSGRIKSDTWNLNIPSDQHKQVHLATMYRAGTRVFYKNYLDMAKPEQNGRLKMHYVDGPADKLGSFQYAFLTRPVIYVYGFSSRDVLCSSYDIFGTTSHELGHANHYYRLNPSRPVQFGKVNTNVKESWADAVQYYITKLEYLDYNLNIDSYASLTPDYSGMPGYGRAALGPYDEPGLPGGPGADVFVKPAEINHQYWPFSGADLKYLDTRLAYSSLIIDLIDDSNQQEYFKRIKTKGYNKMPFDNVKGFTLAEIQGVLRDVKSVEELQTKIKELNTRLHPSLNTDAQIDNLFQGHKNYW